MATTKGKMYLGDTLLSGGGESLVEFCQINPVVKSYLENVIYDSNDYSVSNVSQYASQTTDYNKYQPSGYSVDIESGTLVIADSNNGTMIEDVTDGTKAIYNIVPESGGVYVNVDENGNVVKSGKLIPTGSLRMLHVDGIKNVRDLGGWSCDGGTVKYGKIIRGTTMNGSHTITENGINVLKHLIKINHDLDFRDSTEWSENVSALGIDVKYTQIPYGMYHGAITSGTWQRAFVEAFRVVLDCVRNEETVYIHCESGMDRTGTFCFLLESILGMSQSDIDKDYELSSFFTYPTTLKERNNENYVGMVGVINSYEGDTHRDKTVNYLLTLGISIDEINEFRMAMIDGEAGTLIANVDKFTIVKTLDNSTINNEKEEVFEYQSYYAEITPKAEHLIEKITVTMGGVDITNEVVEGKFVTNGNMDISENGEYDISDYKTVKVNVAVGETFDKHTITHSLNGSTCNNSQTEIIDGQSYGAIISAGDSLKIGSVTVTMDGVVIPSSDLIYIEGGIDMAYSKAVIAIPKVTGDIVINVSTVAPEVNYTNLANPSSPDWKDGYRFGSSGESAQDGTTVSNAIPCSEGDVIRIKGVTLREGTDRIERTFIKADTGQPATNYGYFNTYPYELVDGVYTITMNLTATSIRFAMPTPTDASAVIVTVNEEII